MNQGSKGIVGALTLGAVVLFLSLSSAAQEPIKVGMIATLTGPAGFIGSQIKDVAVIVEEMINAAGGVNGRPLNLIIEDDGGDPSRTLLSIQKLVKRDNVVAILGPTLTPTALAVIPFVEQESIPLITITGSRRVVLPPKKWVFKVSLADDLAIGAILGHMSKRGIKKVALLSDSGGFGEAGRQVILNMARSFDIAIVADERFSPADREVTAQLTRIRQTDAQALLAYTAGTPAVIIAKNYRQLGLKLPFYQSHATGTKRFIELAGEAAEGVIFPAVKVLVLEKLSRDDPYRQAVARFVEQHEKKLGPVRSQFGLVGWDSMLLLAEAIGKAGTDRLAIRDYIEAKQNFIGVTGVFSYSPDDHDGLKSVSLTMVKIENGAWVPAD